MNMLSEIMEQRRRSSQRKRVIERRGRRNIMVLQDRVRKWLGLDNKLGKEEMYANLIAFPMRA